MHRSRRIKPQTPTAQDFDDSRMIVVRAQGREQELADVPVVDLGRFG